MSSSLRRGTLAATASVFAIAFLAACGAGNEAETLGVKPDNAAVSVGHIKIQNVTVITSPDDDDRAVVIARLFNEGRSDQTLTAVSLPGTSTRVQLSPAEGEAGIVVPAGGSVALGGEDNATAEIIATDGEGVDEGAAQPIVFDLSDTGEIRLDVMVRPARGEYAEYGPSALASPTESPAASPSDTGTAEQSPSAGTSGDPDAGSAEDDQEQQEAGREEEERDDEQGAERTPGAGSTASPSA